MLKEEFSVPVIINNGANTAGLAEYEQRQFFLTKKILYCISGQGIRCGFIHHGVFLDRQEGDASSYGHLIVEANGRTCACGRKGCLSAYTSFNAIFAMIEEAGQQPIHTIEQLVHALECGNQTVKEIVANSAHYYGIGIANMTNILHPDAVILHGKLIYQNEFYFNEVVRSIQKYRYLNHTASILGKARSGRLRQPLVLGSKCFTICLSGNSNNVILYRL